MSRKGEESNPFYFDDDEGDNPYHRGTAADDGELLQTRAAIARSENRQLQSLDSSLRVLRETEDIGFQTAEELVRQEEQLVNTEKKLDSINETTKVTQRHITSLKSVFGSLKNRFFGRSETPASSNNSDNIQHSRLREALDEDFSERRRSKTDIPPSSSYGELIDSDDESGLRDISRSSSKQAELDSKLGDISSSLHVLKNLGRGMNRHLTEEEELLQRIADKTEKADMTIEKQNKQMRNLLK